MNSTSSPIGRGILAGFAATVALSILMALKAAMGLMPAMNAIAMLTRMSHGMLGTPATPVIGWIIHFVIGAVLWGGLFTVLYARIPGQGPVARGLVFATAAWLLMMVLVMPMAGAGLFGLHIGLAAPIAALVLHWVFGAALGGAYRALAGHDLPHARSALE